jgi:hypothetical protein
MMTYGIDERTEGPPDTNRASSDTVSHHSEWPYFVFGAGVLALIALRALLFS